MWRVPHSFADDVIVIGAMDAIDAIQGHWRLQI
jgi:hypothetical protein